MMQKEVDSAVQFICGLIQARSLSLDLVEAFRNVLCEVMYGRYKGHWFPDKPYKGSAYRCMRINSNSIDPLILNAAIQSGLSQAQLLQLLPHQLTIWVDPREVSYRFGEDGSVATLYDGNKTTPRIELDNDLGSTGSGGGSSIASSDSVKSSPSSSPVPSCSSPSSVEDEDDVPDLSERLSCRQEVLDNQTKRSDVKSSNGHQFLTPTMLVAS